MKKHYTLLMAALASCMLGQAQTTKFLDGNNVRAGISTGGGLFCKLDTVGNIANDTTFGLFEVPRGSGINAIYAASIGMAGLDANSNLHCSAQRYSATDFFNGPLGIPYNQAYRNYFNRVFKVTSAELNVLINVPAPRPAGQISGDVLLWPAKGNPHVQSAFGINITDDLAPFIDLYPDGIYDPVMGDLPAICGTQGIFFVFNDVNGPQDDSTGANLGVEVRGMAEVYDDPTFGPYIYGKQAGNNAVFVRYQIENKSSASYNNFYISLYEDMDLGCFENDYIGCDTTRDLLYAYNGTDENFACSGVNGYANRRAAHGVKLLNSDLASFTYQTNNAGITSEPSNAVQYYNYMQGLWKNGTPYLFGGNGVNAANTTEVKHLFPGNPNVPEQWSERHPQAGVPMTAGDRRCHGSIGPANLAAGETKEIDLAFFVSYDTATSSGLTQFTIVDTLLRDADLLQQRYQSILNCRANQVVGINEAAALQLSVYPNPSSSLVSIQCEKTINTIRLTDILGNELINRHVNSNNTQVDVSMFPKGVYLLQLSAGKQTATRKVVVN